MITTIPHRVSRATAAAVIMIVFALSLTACGGPSDKEAKTTAVQYLQAVNAGNKERQCSLSVNGQGSKRQQCLATAQPRSNAFASAPEAVRVVDWGDNGKAVAVRVHLRANSETKWNAVGLKKSDDHWLVAAFGWINGDPNKDAAVTGALS